MNEIQEIKRVFEQYIKIGCRGHDNLDDEQIKWMIDTIESQQKEIEKYKSGYEVYKKSLEEYFEKSEEENESLQSQLYEDRGGKARQVLSQLGKEDKG